MKKETNLTDGHIVEFCCFRITAFRRAWDYCFSYPKILHQSPPRGRVVVTGGEIRSRPAKGHPPIIGVAHTGGGPAQSSLGSPTSNDHKWEPFLIKNTKSFDF